MSPFITFDRPVVDVLAEFIRNANPAVFPLLLSHPCHGYEGSIQFDSVVIPAPGNPPVLSSPVGECIALCDARASDLLSVCREIVLAEKELLLSGKGHADDLPGFVRRMESVFTVSPRDVAAKWLYDVLGAMSGRRIVFGNPDYGSLPVIFSMDCNCGYHLEEAHSFDAVEAYKEEETGDVIVSLFDGETECSLGPVVLKGVSWEGCADVMGWGSHEIVTDDCILSLEWMLHPVIADITEKRRQHRHCGKKEERDDGHPCQPVKEVAPPPEEPLDFTGWHVAQEGFADGNGLVNQTVRLLSDLSGTVFLFTRTDRDDICESRDVCRVFTLLEDAFCGDPDMEFPDSEDNVRTFLDILDHIGADPANDSPEKFLDSLHDEVNARMGRCLLGKDTAEDICEVDGVIRASYDWMQDRLLVVVGKGFPFDFGRLAKVSYRMSCDYGYYEGVETMLYDGREHPFAGMFEGNRETVDEIRGYQDIRKEESEMLKIINAASDRCGFYPLHVDIIPESRIDD